MSETLKVDDLRFTLLRSTRRRTVGITVDRDGSLVLTAPHDCSVERVEEIARAKQFWVYSKLAEKNLLFRAPPPKEYVSGESFFYLGRSYRLKLVADADQAVPLRLLHGHFLLLRDAIDRADQHFVRWYTEHGRPWLTRRVERLALQFGVSPSGVEVRSLGYRWGSCTATGGLNFHWRSVLLPPRIIEYIVAHELVHLVIPNHGADFWTRLERAMPDYETRRQWLAEQGAGFF
jgi:predicted metal-dependent hydrolase